MRRFTVPFDIEFEDKIIGGKLSLRQAGWFAIPVMFGFSTVSQISSNIGNLSPVLIIFKIIIFIVLAILACVFSFYKKNTMNYDKYLIKKVRFMIRKKNYKFYE